MARVEAVYPINTEQKSYIYSQIISDIDSVKENQNYKNELGRRNIDWVAGQQWTELEEEAHYQQGREPFVFNEIQHKVDHLVGTQTQTRLDIKTVPREPSDAMSSELLNNIIKWTEQVNDFESLETTVFKEGIIKAASCVVVRWRQEEFNFGYPSVESVPINEMFWDGKAREASLNDARWMARVMEMTIQDAVEEFPEHQEIIERQSGVYTTYGMNTYIVPTRKKEDMSWYNQSTNPARGTIRIIEHTEAIKIYEYSVVDEIQQAVEKFYNWNEAKNYFAGLVDAYTENGVILTERNGSQLVYLTKVKVKRIIRSVILGDELVERSLLNLNTHPWKIYFCYYDEGDYWAFVNTLISPQRLVNRFFSQWDHAIGTSMKNMVTIMPNLLHKNFSIEDFRRESSKTGPVVPVISHQAIQQHPSSQIQPELFQGIDFGINRMNDYAGGRNALGFQENAAESGKAVEARASQAGVSKLPMFDNLRIWKKAVFELVIWWIVNYMSPNQIIRIIGDDRDIKYVELDEYVFDTIKEMKYDLIIDEVGKTDSIRERNLTQLQQLFQVTPGVPPEVMFKMLLPYTGISESQKAELQETMNQVMQYNQQKAEQQKQEQLKQQATDQLQKRKLKETLLSQTPELQTSMDIRNVVREGSEMQEAQKQANAMPADPDEEIILQNL